MASSVPLDRFNPAEYDFDHPPISHRLNGWLAGLWGGARVYQPFFESRGGLRGDERVLDFGCGRGVATDRIARMLVKGGRVTGVDASSYYARVARRRLASFDNAEVVHGDVRDAELELGSYDVVCLLFAIHEIAWDCRQSVLDHLVRLLKPGASLWVLEGTKGSHSTPVSEVREVLSLAGAKEGAFELDDYYAATYRKPSD